VEASAAELTVQCTDTSGRILAPAAIGPGGKQAKPVLDYRQAAGANGPCDDTVHRYYYPPITVDSYPVAAAITG
jgi:hypothetical protein